MTAEVRLWGNLLGLAGGTAVALYLRAQYQRRAKAMDHVAEVERDVAIPLRCAHCASPHAPYTIPIRNTESGSSGKKFYDFHFCLECARVERRRRRFGRVLMIAGWSTFAIYFAFLLGSVFLPSLGPKHPHDWDDLEMLLRLSVIGGVVLIFVGLWTYVKSPTVRIFDAGGDTLFFYFRNQRYRDFFAELNAAPAKNQDSTALNEPAVE